MNNADTIRLDSRLRSVFSLVRRGSAAVDVGSDHAKLICSLVENGLCSRAIATDINPMPLKNAEEEIIRRGLSDKIKTRLCDGLQKIAPEEADDIIIAGMGSETILNIIDDAKWLRNPEKLLILQPMSKPEILREYLCSNGFTILREIPSVDAGRSYSAFSAVYSGIRKAASPEFLRLGLVPLDFSPEAIAYITFQYSILKSIADGLSSSKDPEKLASAEKLYSVAENILSISKGGCYDGFRP